MSTRGMMVTVHLLLPVYDPFTGHSLRREGHAADYVSALLTQELESQGVIMDWGYARDPESGEHLYARPVDMEGEYSSEEFLAEADKMNPPKDPPSLLEAAKEAVQWARRNAGAGHRYAGSHPIHVLDEAIKKEESNV